MSDEDLFYEPGSIYNRPKKETMTRQDLDLTQEIGRLKERIAELEAENVRLTQLLSEDPRIDTKGTWPPEIQRLWEACIRLVDKAEFKVLFRYAEKLEAELANIANAKPGEWDDPSEFRAWAQNRARYALAKATPLSRL